MPEHEGRRFKVTAVRGHIDVSKLGSLGPEYIEVMVELENSMGETASVRYPLNDQPRVGDVIDVPEMAVWR